MGYGQVALVEDWAWNCSDGLLGDGLAAMNLAGEGSSSRGGTDWREEEDESRLTTAVVETDPWIPKGAYGIRNWTEVLHRRQISLVSEAQRRDSKEKGWQVRPIVLQRSCQ